MSMISVDETFFDFLLLKHLSDINQSELDFEENIKNIVNQQVKETIKLLESEEYHQEQFKTYEKKQRFLDSIQEKTEELLQQGITDINIITKKLYEEGRKQGLIDINKPLDIVWGTGDKYALQHLLTYNMGLIQKLTDDTRKDIANEIFKGVLNGESIPKIAKRIKDIPNFKPLEGTKLTANQRAMLIARTETMRAKNTGLLNSYKQYDVEYVDVMPAVDACDACTDFAKIHNPIPLNNVKGFLPLHPRCRCTYAPVSLDELSSLPNTQFESVQPIPKELYLKTPFNIDINENSISNNIDENKLSEILNDNVNPILNNPNLQNIVKDEILTFKKETDNKSKEYFTSLDLNGKIIVKLHEGKSNKVIIPEKVIKEGEKNGLLLCIHNHLNSAPFPSWYDLNTQLNDRSMINPISSNNKGMSVLINKNFLNKDKGINMSIIMRYEDCIRKLSKECIKEYKYELNQLKIKRDKNILNDEEYNIKYNEYFEKYISNNIKYSVSTLDKYLNAYGVNIKYIPSIN